MTGIVTRESVCVRVAAQPAAETAPGPGNGEHGVVSRGIVSKGSNT